jgi:exopolysaccharide biosynthesis polyprenyl glycosylphosphotransferase
MTWRQGIRGSLFVLADLGGIVSGFYLAFALRTLVNPFFVQQFDFSDASTVSLPLYLTAFIWVLTFRQLGLYSREASLRLPQTLLQIVKGSALVGVILTVASFFTSREAYSRSLLVLLVPTSILTISGWRLTVITILRWLSRQGYGIERVAVGGSPDSVRRIAAKLAHQPAVIVCGYISLGADSPGALSFDLPYLGGLGDLGELVEKHQLTRVVCEDRIRNREQLVRLAEGCHAAGASLEVVPDFFTFIPHRMRLTDLGGLPLIVVRAIGISWWDGLIKRLVDIMLAGVILVVLAPLFLVLAGLIAWESTGGVIYRQTRIGKNGRRFTLLKFRSMHAGAEQLRATLAPLNDGDGLLFKMREDPRLTRVGRFTRRYSLDELPQLVNVLRGDMSLTGPRPLPAEDLQKVDLTRYGYWFQQRLRILPGLTGIWQVSGRSELTFEEMVELDIYYMENWSLTLDFEILLRTVSEVLSGRGAY